MPAISRIQRGMVAMVAIRCALAMAVLTGFAQRGVGGRTSSVVRRWFMACRAIGLADRRGRIRSK